MKKPTALKLNGKTLDLSPPRPSRLKIAALLDKSSADDLLTSEALANKASVGHTAVGEFGRDSVYSQYTHRTGQTVYFGNPRAIVALKQFLAEQGK